MLRLRAVVPDLSPAVRIVQAGSFANAFGNGFVLPFLLIYLHNVRGISLGTSGLALAANGSVAVVVSPLIGTLIDRIGARASLALAMIFCAVGFGGYAAVHHPWQAVLASVVSGLGIGAVNPSAATLISTLTTPEQRPGAFAMERVSFNLGVGLGATVGGLIATTSSPGTYVALFVIDAATFIAFLAALAFVPAPPRHQLLDRALAGGYRRVFANRTFLRFVVLDMLLVSVGYAWLQDILPVFAKDNLHVGEQAIGLIFLVNTLTIVLVQLPISRWLRGRRRMVAYALEGGLLTSVWLIVLGAGIATSGLVAAVVVAIAASIFAVGECLHGTVRNPLAIELAAPALVGRYLAILGCEYQLGYAGGRAFGGFMLAASPLGMWAFAATLAATCALYALRLEQRLPLDRRRTPHPANDVRPRLVT